MSIKQVFNGCALAAAAVLLAAGPAAGQEDSLKKYGCLACHAVDTKLVGPAYKDVAEKYKGQADAPDKLFAKVRRGGTGVWGQIPMPPNPLPSDDDLHKMIKYILSL
jgi:cytochrome c